MLRSMRRCATPLRMLRPALLCGQGGGRQVDTARYLLAEAALKGAWGGTVRDGFESYLKDDYDGATIHYLRGWELGYETAAANTAYLLHTERASHGTRVVCWCLGCPPSRALTLTVNNPAHLVGYKPASGSEQRVNQFLGARLAYETSLQSGGTDSALKLGDYYFYGLGGLPTNPAAAAAMYSRASAAGSSQAAFNLGLMVRARGWWHPTAGPLSFLTPVMGPHRTNTEHLASPTRRVLKSTTARRWSWRPMPLRCPCTLLSPACGRARGSTSWARRCGWSALFGWTCQPPGIAMQCQSTCTRRQSHWIWMTGATNVPVDFKPAAHERPPPLAWQLCT